MKRNRPIGLIIIVSYKALFSVLLAIISLALLFTLGNANGLASIAESTLLEGKLAIVETFILRLLKQDPQTLHYTSLILGFYSVITAIEAVGLWHRKIWAEALVLILVGVSIAPEIYELARGFTLFKLGIFIINLAIFVYLMQLFRCQLRTLRLKHTKY